MPLGVDYSVSHTSWRGGLKVSGGEEWGSPEWVGDSYQPNQFLFCSSKQLYPSFGYTNPQRKASSGMLGAVAGVSTASHPPISRPRKCPQQGLFQR